MRCHDGVHGAERPVLDGEAHVDAVGPGLRDVLLDQRSRLRVHHDHDRVETSSKGVVGQEVDDRFAVGADGCQRLDPAVSAGAAGGQDDQGWGAHGAHSRTALAQVMPAPNPVRSSVSPG